MDENQSKRDRIDEISKILASREEQYKNLEQSFQQKTLLLTETSCRLNETMIELEEKKYSLIAALEKEQQAHQRFLEQEFLAQYDF